LPDIIQSKIKELEDITAPFYKLKEIVRRGWVDKLNLENPETVASHTLLMIVLILYFTSNHSYTDKKRLRLIEMVLVHDLAESVVGDITPDSVIYKGKKALENKIFKEMMDKIPSSKFRNRLNASWEDFNAGSSLDAQFVHLIDKLEMIIQANYYLNNRKGVTCEQLQPFKNSTALLLNNAPNLYEELKSRNSTAIDYNLNEIKVILAHLCK
jgi:putative hydrolase of HD superfamily